MVDDAAKLIAATEHTARALDALSAQQELLRNSVESDRLDQRELRVIISSQSKLLERLESIVLTGNGGDSLKSIVGRLSRDAAAIADDLKSLRSEIKADAAKRSKERATVIAAAVTAGAAVVTTLLNLLLK